MISSPDMVMPVSWHVRAVLIALPLLFSFWRTAPKCDGKTFLRMLSCLGSVGSSAWNCIAGYYDTY